MGWNHEKARQSTVVGEKAALHSTTRLFLKTVSLPLTTHILAFSSAQAGIGLLSTAIAIGL